jgi:REP element-mobilizing transposase RayT
MSRKYKFQDEEGLYFVSFATVYWVDVFVRDEYFGIMVDALDYSRKHKDMEIYAWCIMPSHVHLIFRAAKGKPETLLGSLKSHTSKQLQQAIKDNLQESRREWLTNSFEKAARYKANVKAGQFWQHHNKPIELWSPEVIDQKAEYIHQNPVEAGFVTEPWHWKYSSAIDHSGGKGLLEIDLL